MKKTIGFGICAVAALALTMGGCSKNNECSDAASCKDKAACCKDGAKAEGKCCKDAAKSSSGSEMSN